VLPRLGSSKLVSTWIVIGINCVFAIAIGPLGMAPELLVCAAAFWYPASRLAGT
jgi:hypothetical protein